MTTIEAGSEYVLPSYSTLTSALSGFESTMREYSFTGLRLKPAFSVRLLFTFRVSRSSFEPMLPDQPAKSYLLSGTA